MQRLIVVALGLLASCAGYAQSNLDLQPRAEETLRQYEARMDAYFAPKIKRLGIQALVEDEGSEYNQYLAFRRIWEPRLGKTGDFRLLFRQDAMQFGGASAKRRVVRGTAVTANVMVANDAGWQELGPTTKPSGVFGDTAGIGPIEFIAFYAPAPAHMLAGSMMGGLFSSDDGGLTWQRGGTDTKVGRSGVSSAVFDPGDSNTWYAASSGNGSQNMPLFIGPTGGIYRTINHGATWTKIASEGQLGGVWAKLYKLVIDPANHDHLWVAASTGLYFTANATQPSPVWTRVAFSTEQVNDFELRPGDANWQYAAVATWSGGVLMNWRFMYTSDGGATWQPVPNQPASTATASALTIEVSPAKADNLYGAVMQANTNTTLAVYDFSANNWNIVTTAAHVDHGSGHGFGVDPFDANAIYLSESVQARRYDATTGTYAQFPGVTNTFHSDVEDIVPHPSHHHEVWVAHHGGVAYSPDDGTNWYDRSQGLGVALPLRMAASATDPRYVLVGLYHNGSILTDSPWQEPWTPAWRIIGCCDGLTPLIDPIASQNMWITEQYGRWYRSTNHGQTFSIKGPKSPNWIVDGAFDMLNPATQYRIVDNAGLHEIHRSVDGGNTWTRISRFDLLWPHVGGPEYVLWAVFTPNTSSGTLLVHLLERQSLTAPWHHHLYRTKIATDPTPANVIASWEQLPLPGDQWISDVEFDRADPNIVYIANSSPTNMGLSQFGTMMVVKVDYSNPTQNAMYACTGPLCEDLTQNLPNAATGARSLAVDEDNSGLYFVCDYGAYYSTADSRAAGNGWSKLGSELPNTIYSGIELNFVNHKVRVASMGRGMWEHDLPATISGTKFDDVNSNGVRDVGEPGLPNWTIKLVDGSGNVTTATTNAAGRYVFTMVPADDYILSETLQSGWTQTYPASGMHPVHVEAGDHITSLDFGNRLSAPATCIAPPANMTAWWPFDDTTGVAGDLASFNNVGTLNGGPTNPPGKVSNALHLNGTSQFVSVPSHLELNPGTGDLSIDAWVRTSAMGVRPIVDKRDGAIFGYTLFLFDGRLGFQMADRALPANCSNNNSTTGCTNYIAPVGSAPAADGAWHHVAVTVDRDQHNGGNLWLDGAIVLTFDPTIRNQGLDTRAPLLIGKRSAVSSAVYWSRDLDEIEIFKRALTASEIQSLVKAGPNGKCKCSPPDPCITD